MPNHLINETSPYLLQHANNPVDWYPWGPEALHKALEENKPIFLSIGYAACHWCHVMEHESFEDPQTAQLLNEHFISIKVDREERPDLDQIYMKAVVAMTGQGGWPMSLFLTPQGEPFFGGTYFPATRRYGMYSFKEVLRSVAQSWQNERGEIKRVGHEMVEHLQPNNAWNGAAGVLRPETLTQATDALLSSYDWQQGGWGQAPRFPQPMAIDFLLIQASHEGSDLGGKALSAASHALEHMSRGGMYDVVAGGFHRYSTDNQWLVPHFEKMLYDNGQLALAYLHAYLMTKELPFKAICTQTLDFITREMTDPGGGFYSSLDADSEGEEGKYYVWTPLEIETALADPADWEFIQNAYPITPGGNFEGKNVLQRKSSLPDLASDLGLSLEQLLSRLDAVHQKLLSARQTRTRPLTDDKVLVSWNALTLRAFAQAARYLDRPDYLKTAQSNASFLLEKMYPEGRLLRAWRKGQAHHNAFLEDYATLILALLDLYETDADLRWYEASVELAQDMLTNFRDPQGGFFDTRQDHDQLIARPKETQDNATPSGNALAAGALLRLSAYAERSDWQALAVGSISAIQAYLTHYPTAFAFWLQDFDFAVGPTQQIAIIGPQDAPETQALVAQVWSSFRPRIVFATSSEGAGPESPEILHYRDMQEGKPTAYVCENFTCKLPVNTIEGLRKQIQ